MSALEPFFKAYIAAWAACTIAALAVYLRDPARHAISRPQYWRQLAVPWKLVTFAISATGVTVIAPYTTDPTWDYFDAAMMSIFAYTTSPWTVGTLYLAARGRRGAAQAFASPFMIIVAAMTLYFVG